jgi:hypothetical protein
VTQLRRAHTFVLIYMFIKPTKIIQDFLSWIIYYVLITPLLFLMKLMNKIKKRKYRGNYKYIDLNCRWHRMTYYILKKIFSLNKTVTGQYSIFDKYCYERLLKWDKDVPLYAYESTKTLDTWEVLGKTLEDGSRGWDAIWLNKSHRKGTLKIISNDIVDNGFVEVQAVYMSGASVGKQITLSPHKIRKLSDFNRIDEDSFILIYLPPNHVFLLIMVIVLAISFLKFIMDIMDVVNLF